MVRARREHDIFESGQTDRRSGSDRGDVQDQIEFTHQAGHSVGKAPTKDNLLVFYHPEINSWEQACDRMGEAGFERVPSWNPYWDLKGRTFEDPDGYRLVIHN